MIHGTVFGITVILPPGGVGLIRHSMSHPATLRVLDSRRGAMGHSWPFSGGTERSLFPNIANSSFLEQAPKLICFFPKRYTVYYSTMKPRKANWKNGWFQVFFSYSRFDNFSMATTVTRCEKVSVSQLSVPEAAEKAVQSTSWFVLPMVPVLPWTKMAMSCCGPKRPRFPWWFSLLKNIWEMPFKKKKCQCSSFHEYHAPLAESFH